MELRALVYIDDPIGRGLAVPHCVVQETLDSVQDHLRPGGDDKEDKVEMTRSIFMRMLVLMTIGDGDAVLPQSAAGQILPKCGYYSGILFPKMWVRSIQNAGILKLKHRFYAGMPNIPLHIMYFL